MPSALSQPAAPPSSPPRAAAHAHGEHMDRIYRFTRHIYDLTRKFFLLGRDDLLHAVPIEATLVLEMGCGTARNLIKLARLRPNSRLFGLDASSAMLETASAHLSARALDSRVTLRLALAEDLDHARLFGLDRPFDAILFPYSLSMMPTWPAALDAALANLRPGGQILIVDFWDQATWPAPLRRLLVWWLSLFSVHYRDELLARLRDLDRAGTATLSLRGIGPGARYAYLATLTRR